MKRTIALLGALLGVAAAPVHAEVFDVNLGHNSVGLNLSGPLSRVIPDFKGQYDAGVIIRPKSSDDLFQAHVGALITGDAGARDFDAAAGLGLRAIYVGRDGDSGGAFALGGQFEMRMPSFNRLGLSGYAWYAPGVTSLGQLDRYLEYSAAVDYQVVRDAAVYVGYRNISYDIGAAGDVTADAGVRVGLRLNF